MAAPILPVSRVVRGCAAAALTLAATFAAAPASAQQAGGGTESSVLSGAYTADQATRGQAVFRETCGNCHSTSEFSGAPFQRKWAGQPILTFFDHVRLSMPLDNPGGLSRAEYSAVLAYILKLNAYPEGKAELPAEEEKLRRIRFEIKP